MNVVVKASDCWFVYNGNYFVAGPFKTNAEAWRALDRLEGQPINRSENTSDWSWNKRLHGE